MRIYLRLLVLLCAVTSLTILSSCTKEQFDSETIEANVDHPTFSELVTYHEDGSFSAALTGEEMEYVMTNEFGDSDTDNMSAAFAQILINNAPGAAKGSDLEKSNVTYGAVAIGIGLGSFGTFFQFQGIGGIPSNGSTNQSLSTCISRQTYPVAFAFGFVFSSTGVGYPVSYNDSSFDKNCSFFSPNWRVSAKAGFNTINSLFGSAAVGCCGLQQEEYPQEYELSE